MATFQARNDKPCPAPTTPLEECQGDAPEDRDGNTIGFQTDAGTNPCASPILLDVSGDGFRLTDGAGGVLFDLNGDGHAGPLAWTVAGTDDAWLALDRDGDGLITSGRELFGNFTPQPPSSAPNGFAALAEFDRPAHGGNGDGVISRHDPVYAALRLWRDANHDGVSEAGELRALAALGIEAISLDYRELRRRDRHGNRFRYRAKAYGSGGGHTGRWAYDVFLVSGQ